MRVCFVAHRSSPAHRYARLDPLGARLVSGGMARFARQLLMGHAEREVTRNAARQRQIPLDRTPSGCFDQNATVKIWLSAHADTPTIERYPLATNCWLNFTPDGPAAPRGRDPG